jgi:hypothetical protein
MKTAYTGPRTTDYVSQSMPTSRPPHFHEKLVVWFLNFGPRHLLRDDTGAGG